MNKPTPASTPQPVDLAVESVAGEEDPGASIDIAAVPDSVPPSTPNAHTSPRSEPLSGTPGPGEERTRGG